MDGAPLSDLEEGEILEQEVSSPTNSGSNEYIVMPDIGRNSRKVNVNIDLKNYNYGEMPFYKVEDNLNSRVARKMNFTDENLYVTKAKCARQSCMTEYITSEDDYNSDEDYRYNHVKNKEKEKRNFAGSTSGSVEEIMSQINQMINRKGFGGKRKRYKDTKYSSEKYYEKKIVCKHRSQEAISRKPHKSNIKGKKHSKHRHYTNDLDSERTLENEISKGDWKSLAKRRLRSDYYGHHTMDPKSNLAKPRDSSSRNLRDFDEVRKTLLEELKKKQEKKEFPDSVNKPCIENVESGQILNDESEVESINVVETSSGSANAEALNDAIPKQMNLLTGGDDEMDLAQLRLIALASNKKRCTQANALKHIDNGDDNSSMEVRSEDSSFVCRDEDDGDLDRNELLLRAEALKTALLKKHQRRKNKLRTDNYAHHVESSSDNDVTAMRDQDDSNSRDGALGPESENLALLDSVSEFLNQTDSQGNGNESKKAFDKGCNNNEEPAIQCDSLPNRNIKNKMKRKKRRSITFSNDVKENAAQVIHVNQSAEEDCRNLRNQLLCDLIKKKSLKFLEKKTVLMEKMQKSATVTTGKNKVNNKLSAVSNNKPVLTVSSSNKNESHLQTQKMTTKIPKPEIQRIIVHLGSEDSSEDDAEGTSERANGHTPPSDVTPNESSQPPPPTNEIDESVKVDYEKKVMLLLDQAQRNIENEMLKAKQKNASGTPEAVYKHLPPSQRLEYIRLKQKIAEREKLRKEGKKIPLEISSETTHQNCMVFNEKKLSNTVVGESCKRIDILAERVNSGGPGPGQAQAQAQGPVATGDSSKNSKLTGISSGDLTSSSSSSSTSTSTVGHGSQCKGPQVSSGNPSAKDCVVAPCPPAKTANSCRSVPSRRMPNQALLSKLKLLFKKIKLERTLEDSYDKEIFKLKAQLSVLEKKKSEQRSKIKKLSEESMKMYKVMQNMMKSQSGSKIEVRTRTERKVECAVGTNETKSTEPDENVAERLTAGAGVTLENVETKPKKEDVGAGTKDGHLKLQISKSEAEAKELKGDEEAVMATTTATATSTSTSTVTGSGTQPELAEDLKQYHSPLQGFGKRCDLTERLDPNVIVCQFDLLGVCRDEGCAYQHFRST